VMMDIDLHFVVIAGPFALEMELMLNANKGFYTLFILYSGQLKLLLTRLRNRGHQYSEYNVFASFSVYLSRDAHATLRIKVKSPILHRENESISDSTTTDHVS
jgi:hypothetical protein